jgi:hypothetical protein
MLVRIDATRIFASFFMRYPVRTLVSRPVEGPKAPAGGSPFPNLTRTATIAATFRLEAAAAESVD